MKKPKPFVFTLNKQKYQINVKADLDVEIARRFSVWIARVAQWAEEKQSKKEAGTK